MERRPRQRRKNRTAAAEEEEPRSIHDIPDDLLRLILLRLDSPLWLLRAACACKRWRRAVVAGADGGRAFLRLARSLHPPAAVGHYHERGGGLPTAFVSSSPPAPIDGGRFSLDSIPVRLFAGADWTVAADWAVQDCHGGLVLLRRRSSGRLPHLIVCDPLTHLTHWFRCISLQTGVRAVDGDYSLADTFLLDGEDGHISLSNFRVLYRFYRCSPCVFSTAAGGGNCRPLRRWAGDCSAASVAGRVDGSLYLSMATGNLLVLDNGRLEFSKVNLPSHVDTSNHEPTFTAYKSAFTVVHGAGPGPTSPPRMWIIHAYGEQLEFFRLDRGTGEWVLEHSIPKLSEATRGLPGVEKTKHKWVMVDVVVATGTGTAVLSSACDRGNRRWFFSVEMDTKELQVVPLEVYSRTKRAFAYTLPWPQLLQACPS